MFRGQALESFLDAFVVILGDVLVKSGNKFLDGGEDARVVELGLEVTKEVLC